MPWNITASLQGSRLGSASSIPRPFDSEEFSSQHQLNAMGRSYGRLASVSPLARRSRLGDPSNHERLSSLSIARGDFFDDEGPVTNFNLEGDVHHGQDYDLMFDDYQQVPEREPIGKQHTSKIQNILPSLNTEEINFFTFMEAHLVAIQPSAAIVFSNLLPPDTTSKVVATKGLIHLLTFATNGVVKIEQNAELLHHQDGDEETVDFSEIFISINL
jgi:meiotic recombination protein REC8